MYEMHFGNGGTAVDNDAVDGDAERNQEGSVQEEAVGDFYGDAEFAYDDEGDEENADETDGDLLEEPLEEGPAAQRPCSQPLGGAGIAAISSSNSSGNSNEFGALLMSQEQRNRMELNRERAVRRRRASANRELALQRRRAAAAEAAPSLAHHDAVTSTSCALGGAPVGLSPNPAHQRVPQQDGAPVSFGVNEGGSA